MATRDYQSAAADGIIGEFDSGTDSTLAVMPTGTGKTHMFCDVAERMHAKTGKRTLILAHREELVTQARNKIAELTNLSVDIEMAEKYSYTSDFYRNADVVVSSIQTQNAGKMGGRKTRFKKADFGLVIVDEAHHAPAKSYRSVLDYYSHEHIKVLGVTATPDRKDEKALGQIFKSVAYVYEIFDAIQDGWLVPIMQQSAYVDDMEFANVRTTAGDLNLGDLDRVMGFEKVLHGILNPTMEVVGDRQTVIFAVSIGHAERMCEILNRHKFGCARFVCGKTPKEERRKMFRDYLDGEFQYLTNVGVCTEGVDLPRVGAVVMARPTKSRALYCLDGETEILTKQGWKRKEDVLDGPAAAIDPHTGNLIWTNIEAIIVRPPEPGENFAVCQNPQKDIRVTDRHRILVSNRYGRNKHFSPYQFIEAGQLISDPAFSRLPVAAVQVAVGLPITDDEIRFIGLVMSDGTINKHNNAITMSAHQPWCEYIHNCIEGCGFKYNRFSRERETAFSSSSTMICWTISKGKPRGRDKDKRGWGALEPYLSKDLAAGWELCTEHQLGILLEALNVGDGCKYRPKTWTKRTYDIYCGNKIMADRLQSLCVRRGWRCAVNRGDWNENPIYIMHIKKQVFVSNKREHWHFEEPREHELVWCIETTVGTIVTRRNGKVCIMGNCQMLGRGTRPLPGLVDPHPVSCARKRAIADSTKPHLLVLDFVGQAGKHKLMTAANVLGGKYDDEVVDRVNKERAEEAERGEAPDPEDIEVRLKKAEMDIAEDREKNRRRHIKAVNVRYRLVRHDPFALLDVSPRREYGWDSDKPATDKQLAALDRFGLGQEEVREMTKNKATQLIGRLINRRKKGLCTYKQAKILLKNGVDNAERLTFAEASAKITVLARNWNRKRGTG